MRQEFHESVAREVGHKDRKNIVPSARDFEERSMNAEQWFSSTLRWAQRSASRSVSMAKTLLAPMDGTEEMLATLERPHPLVRARTIFRCGQRPVVKVYAFSNT